MAPILPHPIVGDGERESLMACLDLAPMRISVQLIITHRDLALVGNMGSHPGDEFMAVDVEPRVVPGENPFRPFGAEKLPADKVGEDLPGEELRQPRVVDPRAKEKGNKGGLMAPLEVG